LDELISGNLPLVQINEAIADTKLDLLNEM